MLLNIYDRDKVLNMLKMEQKIRYSPQIQRAYTEQYLSGVDIGIEKEIQKYVLRTHGYSDDCLEEYWKIPKLYWNDQEVKNSIFLYES